MKLKKYISTGTLLAVSTLPIIDARAADQVYVCIACAAGQYSDGTTECKNCPAGTASNVPMAKSEASCQSCKPGYYQPHEGQATCLPAEVGRYAPYYKMTSTLPCPAGTWSSGTAAACNNCTNKPSNSYYLDGYTGRKTNDCPWDCDSGYTQSGNECVKSCGPGKKRNGDSCEDCPANTYKDWTGTDTSCTACASGYTSSAGSTSSSSCKKTFCEVKKSYLKLCNGELLENTRENNPNKTISNYNIDKGASVTGHGKSAGCTYENVTQCCWYDAVKYTVTKTNGTTCDTGYNKTTCKCE